MPTLATWNANNLFLRYRLAGTYPGVAEPDGELPDILCLQEVENLDVLRVFNQDYLGGH